MKRQTTVQVRFFRFENTVRLAKCLKIYDLKKRYYYQSNDIKIAFFKDYQAKQLLAYIYGNFTVANY